MARVELSFWARDIRPFLHQMLLPGETWMNDEGLENWHVTAINKSQKETYNNDAINKICHSSM